MRYFIKLSYNGTPYHGWQIQPDTLTVQGVIETALSTLLKRPISIMGAGRTDTGVHATEMYAHFDYDIDLLNTNLVYKLNAFLPKDIVIHDLFKVNKDAHTRFHATSRTYLYRITLGKNAFTYNNTYFVKQKLDVDKMNQASKILLDYRDFQCFSKTNTDVKTYYCNITTATWFFNNNELHFTITADRFLRNMVRAIVGTMVNIGVGKLNIEDLHRIIASKNRSEAGFSVPAQALYLTKIEYPKSINIINE